MRRPYRRTAVRKQHPVVSEDAQVRHTLPQHAEDDLEPLPQVGEVVLLRDVTLGPAAQRGDAVLGAVEIRQRRTHPRQEPALFGA